MKTRSIIFAVLVAAFFGACQKTEFMPPPEGEAIPYEELKYDKLATILEKSPYQLFNSVWKKSTLNSKLTDRLVHTLLVPTDEALSAAGYSAASIAAMAPEEADQLVRFYTIEQRVSKEEVEDNIRNLRVISMLDVPRDWKIQQPYAYDQRTVNLPYIHYLGTANDQLLVNGVPMGNMADGIPAANGYVWPINKLIATESRSFLEIMEADPRFSMLLDVKKRSDSVFDNDYLDIMEINTGRRPRPESYTYRMFYNELPLTVNRGLITGGSFPSTIFLPTNEAFEKAGFNSVDDVLAWNKKYGAPMVYNPSGQTHERIIGGGFPSDTVLMYHFDWGRDLLPYSPQWGKAPDPVPAAFYQNDMYDELLGNVLLNNRVGNMTLVMPLTFGRDDQGRVLVQLKGSDAPPATIIETINTALGPLHLVDRLFIPKGLKLK